MFEMSKLKFHLTDENKYFNGRQFSIEEAEFILFGVPFDATSTYRTGSRYAPQAIRCASINIETYSFRTLMDALDLKIHDAGDLPQTSNTEEIIERISEVISEIVEDGKIPIMIGGEHTITYGAVKALKNISTIIFDAHMDLRDEYPMGVKISHATVSRRIGEVLGVEKLLIMGVRATCKEEIEYAKKIGLIFKTSMEMIEKEVCEYIGKISNERLWISIDMDVLDPSIAPGVANPEPEGINLSKLLDTLEKLVSNNRVIGFDIVEVTPAYDNGITSIVASKIIFELACMIKNSLRNSEYTTI
ncbi:MAG: agmatinase [Candidatus Methanomethylicia archaeon]